MSSVKIYWNQDNDPGKPLWGVSIGRQQVADYLFSTVAAGAGSYIVRIYDEENNNVYANQVTEVFNRWMADNPDDQYMDESYQTFDLGDREFVQLKKH